MKILEKELKMPCIRITIGCHRRIRKAVVPTASYGANLFPASKALSTALFPIVDIDGYAKPAILILVEEALNAGIDEIFLIISPHDRSSFESLFNDCIPIDQYQKLPPKLQSYSQHILNVGSHVRYIVQENAEGLGHAIYQAKEYLQEPFLLMLGDHLYRSLTHKSCVEQMMEVYYERGNNLLGLKVTDVENIIHYGTVAGHWIKNETMLNITEIIEKPSVEYARKHLRIASSNDDDKYLTCFGLYILDGSRLMELLENNIKNGIKQRGLYQLTPCIEQMRMESNLDGFVVQGKRFDIGSSAEGYIHTLPNFHKNPVIIKHSKL